MSVSPTWFVVVICWVYSLLLGAVNCTRATVLGFRGKFSPFAASLHILVSLPLGVGFFLAPIWKGSPYDSEPHPIALPIIALVSLALQWRWLRLRPRRTTRGLRISESTSPTHG